MGVALQTVTNELTHVFLLSVGAFLLAMFLTPVYTFFAYRYRFWKKQRSESTDGKKLKVFAKFQAAKLRRNIPTMAGVIGVISIFIVTFFFNLDRAQTWGAPACRAPVPPTGKRAIPRSTSSITRKAESQAADRQNGDS